jgi:ABC-type glycerol-3-phosphate transport system substrate-binding protein
MPSLRSIWRIARPALLLALVLVSVGCAAIRSLMPAPTPEPVEIRFAYRQHTVSMEPLLNAFHAKYPWITVKLVEIDRWNGGAMDAAIRDGQVDVFRDSRDRAIQLARQDLLKPMEEFLTDDWHSIREDYYRGVWEAMSINGVQYGVPAGLDLYVSYVNKTALQTLGIEVATQNWTLFDMLVLSDALHYPDGLPGNEALKVAGCCTTPESLDSVIFIYLYGGSIVDDLENPTRPTLDDQDTIEAVQWYSDLFNLHAVAPDPAFIRSAFPRGGLSEGIIRGYCGVWFGWYSNRGGLDTPAPWTVDWQMLPLPKNDAGFELGDVDGYYMTKDCAHPREVAQFVRFLADNWQAAGQKLPPRKSLAQSDEYAASVGPDVATVAQSFSEQVILVPYENSDALYGTGEALIMAIYQIVMENLDPEPVLTEAQRQSMRSFD